jgi:hypothetical protein
MNSPLEMNPEIRARWTAALRSGDYQQGQTTLRQKAEIDGFPSDQQQEWCCLGVLCDLAEKAGVVSGTYSEDHNWWHYDGACDYLPQSVQQWAGLGTNSPEVGVCWSEPVTELATLAELNDGDGWTFAQIADAIDGVETAVSA